MSLTLAVTPAPACPVSADSSDTAPSRSRLGFVTPSPIGPVAADPLHEIVQTSLPGVRFLANRIASRLPAHVDVEDLIQVGVVGLLQSADRFDPERGVKFQTYANRRVEGAMLDYLRSLDWRPRSVRQRSRKLDEAFSTVEQRLGESPSQEVVALEIGISDAELDQWMQDSASCGDWQSTSFPEQSPEEGSRDLLAELADPADSPETTVEKVQMSRVMTEAVDHLPTKERLVVFMYYYEQLTMKEIGEALGVRQGRVSQLHSQAIERLRKRMQATFRKQPQGKSAPEQVARQRAA